jgi:hypothetical protein
MEIDKSKYEKFVDYTRAASLLLNDSIPDLVRYVEKFKVTLCADAVQKRKIGPYHMEKKYLILNCTAWLDPKPLLDLGVDLSEEGEIDEKTFEKAYPDELVADEIRNKSRELLKYLGINDYSFFEFDGTINWELA